MGLILIWEKLLLLLQTMYGLSTQKDLLPHRLARASSIGKGGSPEFRGKCPSIDEGFSILCHPIVHNLISSQCYALTVDTQAGSKFNWS